MWRALIGSILLLAGVVMQILALLAWFRHHDHGALGFMLFASLSLGYSMVLIQRSARSRR
jgi:hypothetical protein